MFRIICLAMYGLVGGGILFSAERVGGDMALVVAFVLLMIVGIALQRYLRKRSTSEMSN